MSQNDSSDPISTKPLPAPTKIVKFFDGDSFLLEFPDIANLCVEARMFVFDCPEVDKRKDKTMRALTAEETSQYQWGALSLQRSTELMASGISATFHGTDLYKRQLVMLYDTSGGLLGETLLQEGLAVLYRERGTVPKANIEKLGRGRINQLIELESKTRVQQIGLWGDDNFINPSVFRAKYKSR